MAMDKLDCIELFERQVERQLQECGFDLKEFSRKGLCAGAAVSGGADSVSLLMALGSVCKKYSISLKVITVDHNIRSAEESGGDARFVKELCDQLGVPVVVKVFEPGKVSAVAIERGNGVEEAARFLRYSAFEEFCKCEGCGFVALAHNRNDQVETVLMRFLQGSGTDGLCGIQQRRGIFVRPLLKTGRDEIEAYLEARDVSWRTDATNFDVHFLRNRIRQELVPFLAEKFPGFDKALLNGAEKAGLDKAYFDELRDDAFWKVSEKGDSISVQRNLFCKLPSSLQVRQLYSGFDLLKVGGRIPYSVVKSFLELAEKGVGKVECGLAVMECSGGHLWVKKADLIATESSFFAIIDRNGSLEFPGFTVRTELCSPEDLSLGAKVCFESEKDVVVLEKVPVPFCVRSRQLDDYVRTKSGGMKSVSDVLSDFCVRDKNSVPVLQELYSPDQRILGVIGSVLGFENWIVKG